VRIDDLMQSLNLVFLRGEYILCLALPHVEVGELRFQFGLGCVVLILHGKDVFIDWDFILEEVVQFIHALTLKDLLVLQ
jgi:hypothetical protein